MRTPRHLWTGEWRAESERAREEAQEAARLRPAPAPTAPRHGTDDAGEEPAGRDRPRGALLLGLALAVVALVGGAFAAGMLLDGGSGSKHSPDPLPAVASKPITPMGGKTRAGTIYTLASPAVVSIRTNEGEGTGFVIDRKGTIVTNDHVVGTSTHVLVRFGENGDAIDGDVLGTDPSSDLAVVNVDTARMPRGVKPLQFADSGKVRIGDFAVAIGNPFGLDRTATQGIVSGVGRSIASPNGFEIDQVIQTDAPINPGNSGGPLLDDSGHVIGVNSQIATAGTNGNIGIGFAVPSNTVRAIVPRLARGEAIPHPYLGVTTSPASPTSPDGARVEQLIPGGPAARAGVQTGDVIKRVDGTLVQDPSDVAKAIGDNKPGDTVDVVVERGGRTLTLHAKLLRRPAHIP